MRLLAETLCFGNLSPACNSTLLAYVGRGSFISIEMFHLLPGQAASHHLWRWRGSFGLRRRELRSQESKTSRVVISKVLGLIVTFAVDNVEACDRFF